MPEYILKTLHRFQHPTPIKPAHSPVKHVLPDYGAKVQYVDNSADNESLPPSDIKHIQQVAGTLLYYARAVDNTMLVVIRELSQEQSKDTKSTLEALVHLLNYAASYSNAEVRFHRNGMILHMHSDGSYL